MATSFWHTTFRAASRSALILLAAFAAAPGSALAQATTSTSINVAGGAQAAGQTVPAGQARFAIRVPLRPNAENVLTLVATDTDGRTASVENLRIAQISLTEIVRAQVTAQRLSTPEVKQLVAEGVISLADPTNYNVSRFVVVLTVGGQQVEVRVPVVRRIEELFAEGPPITVGCGSPGQGLTTSDRAISIPCGDGGGGGSVPDTPPLQIIPFEMAPAVEGMPPIPGVIIIEGRIKTLKEFFKVDLLLMNVSSLFTLGGLTARLEVPAGALTPVAPAGGSIALPDIGPGQDASGQFIVRGDLKGVHTVTAYFGGQVTGSFLQEPVPFSGSASTDLEVKGPPKMDVKVTHPDFVTANQAYDLTVTITNTDDTLDALYTSLALDVGADADLIDDATGALIVGPVVRDVGDILRGKTIVQRYRVMPLVSGGITSCVGAADANIQLSVVFTGGGPGCAIGTLPSDRLNPDGKPTVTVVPAHNTVDVGANSVVVALFSDRMIEPTITAGFSGATFTVSTPGGGIVPGTLSFTELFEATSAIFKPDTPLTPNTEYTIVVNPTAFNLNGLALASGITARFTTSEAPPAPGATDTTAPTVGLAVEPPIVPQSVGRGKTVLVLATPTDAVGVTRVDLLLDGALIDTKAAAASLHFMVETGTLDAGSSHVLSAQAFDRAGNVGIGTLSIQIAPDVTPPVATIANQPTVGRGNPLPVLVQATDDGRVARVDLFVDGATGPAATGMVEPFQFALQTADLAPGPHALRAVVTDGAGNQTQVAGAFQVTTDAVAPLIGLVSPRGARFRTGLPLAFAVQATDDTGVASITFRLDGESSPRAAGDAFTLDTTGLALGAHVMRVTATDTSGNAATLEVAFELIVTTGDTTPPAAVDVLRVTLTAVTGAVVGVTGAPGAAEAGGRVVITNQQTQASAAAVAAPDGSFSAQVEAAGGQSLSLVVVDEAGNVGPGVAVVVPAAAILQSLAVSPSSVALSRSHTSEQLGVTGFYSDGSQRLLSSGLTFTSSVPGIASATATGLVLPGQNGSAVITVGANVPGVVPVAVPVTVDFSAVVGIVAEPSTVTMAGLGRTQRITVSARFADDTTRPFSGIVRFATANPNVATVDGSGLISSTGIGSTTITAAATGFPPATALVVVNAVQPTDLIITPISAAFTSLGQTQALTIQYRYSDGTVGSGAFPVTYQSLDDAVTTVTAGGVITAAGEGLTSVVVRSVTFVVNVQVSVMLPTTLPAPEITSLGRPIAGETDTVAILGSNFAGNPAENFVTVNGLHAEVIGASHERLIALVPRGATSGPVQVRVAGQVSNTMELAVYVRTARVVLGSDPFPAVVGSAPIGFGSASFYLQPGDQVMLAADPNTIKGSTWSGLVAPEVIGSLILTVDGTDVALTPAGQPMDLTGLLPSVTQPTLVTLGLRLEPVGSAASSRGLAIIAGPPGTGVFSGQRNLTGDTIDQRIVIRFRTTAPDGTKFAATTASWYTVSGGFPNGSAGGAIIDGVPTPNHGSFRTFTASGGEVAVTYSDVGVLANFGTPVTAVIALVAADASGNVIPAAYIPVAEARVLLGALDSASILPQQTSVLADGVDRPIVVDINSARDNFGNPVPDGTRLAVTTAQWYRSDGGYPNGSAGGVLIGGISTPNNSNFQTVTLASGAAQVIYSAGPGLVTSGTTNTAVLAAVVANADGSKVTDRPFAEATILRTALDIGSAPVVAVPAQLTAAAADHRSVITLSNLTDASGLPVPDGTRIAVTAAWWYRLSDGGYPNSSFGGTIVGGDPSPSDGRFRSFVITGGQVSFTYSNAGLVLDRGATATTVIAIMPAAGNGNYIGSRPFAEVRIVQGGVSSATIVATPISTLADGARRPIAIAVTNVRDALGNVVPDGVRVALTASVWYRRSDGGYPNGSAGGILIDGVPTPNDSRFHTYTLMNGRIDATYSAESIAPLSPGQSRSAIIAAVTASQVSNATAVSVPFGEGTVAVSSVETAAATVSPTSLYADRQGRTSVMTMTGLVDAQGLPVPDGTKVAITASTWYRISDGGYPNGSAGGTMLGGDVTPNDSRFRTYTVTNGQVTATYSNLGLFVDVGGSAPAILSVLPATPAGNTIGSLPLAAATVTLAGADSATVIAPATATRGSTVPVTLMNLRDGVGNLIPDGARVAVTAASWYNRDGSFGNGSVGGTITGGVTTPNDSRFQTFVVSGGQVTFSVALPGTSNVTTVLSVLSADGSGNKIANLPFATFAIRAQ